MKMMNKVCALVLSVALCAGMAAPAFAYGGEPVEEAEQPVLTSATDEEDVVTVTDEETGALTPEGNLTLVDDYHTNYSDGSGQQFITLVSKSGNTFYLVIDRNAKGQQTVHFMNLVDEADLLALMEEEEADAYTAEKEAAAQAEQDRLKAEEEAKKAAEEAAASGTEQPKENKVTKIASGFLGVVVLIALAAGGIFYAFTKQKQKKQAEKEAQLSALKNDMEARKGDAQTLSAEKEKLENELAAIQNKLADKQEKLQTADRQLSELKENMDAIQERTEELKEEAYKYSRDVHSKVDSLLKDAMLENMVNEWREMSAKMKPSERQLFDDTLLCSVAERGTEVMRCATMLFLGMVDDATTFAETHGGGGGGNDLKWGRDEDEDNRAWALRCMKMASRMMRPSSGKKAKR